MNRRRNKSSGPALAPDQHHFNDAVVRNNKSPNNQPCKFVSVSAVVIVLVFISITLALYTGMSRGGHQLRSSTSDAGASKKRLVRDNVPDGHPEQSLAINKNSGRTITSLQDLSPSELHPKATSTRYTVDPPADELPITLVTCETTKGLLHMLVHPSWAPLGASRFLRMVSTKYFSSKIAMMRCLKGFLCQFGLAGDPKLNAEYVGKNTLPDDPNWLPEGPTHRTNDLGVKRFSKGFLAYAGGGKDSRSNQLIVSLADNEGLGGGSPWEVPWGEVVGVESFATLDKMYTGYGEKGPSQGRLSREGSSDAVAQEFPMLDYILSCDVVDSEQNH